MIMHHMYTLYIDKTPLCSNYSGFLHVQKMGLIQNMDLGPWTT